jgi:hypothetical protein
VAVAVLIARLVPAVTRYRLDEHLGEAAPAGISHPVAIEGSQRAGPGQDQ